MNFIIKKNPKMLLIILTIVLFLLQGCSAKNNALESVSQSNNPTTSQPSIMVTHTDTQTPSLTTTQVDSYPEPVFRVETTGYPWPELFNPSPSPEDIITPFPTLTPTLTPSPTESGPCSTEYPYLSLTLTPDQQSGWCKLDHPLGEIGAIYGYRLIYPERWSVRLAGVMGPNLMFNDNSTRGDKPEIFLTWVINALPIDMADQAMSSGYELVPPEPLIDPQERRLEKQITTIDGKQTLVVDTQRDPIRMKYYFFISETGNQPEDARRFLIMVKVKVDQSYVNSASFLDTVNDIKILIGSVEFYQKD